MNSVSKNKHSLTSGIRKTPGDKVFNAVIYIVTAIFTFMCIYPIYYVIIYSISDPILAQKGITFYPKGFSLSGYQAVFKLDSIYTAFLISVARTVLGTLITVFCCSFFAYLMTQYDMPCRKFMYRFLMVTMYVGGGLIPTFLLYKNLNLTNSFLVYIIPGAFSAYNVILIKTYMESIAKSLEESAQIDGAGYVKIFFKIMVPVSMPILATIAVFSAVGQWGAWFDSMLYITNPKLHSLQYVLYQYLNEAEALTRQLQQQGSNLNAQINHTLTPESIKMSITVIVILPILFVYPFMQRYFVKGIMIGAVKG